MDWLQKISDDNTLKEKLYSFLNQHGLTALDEAIQNYSNMQQEYLCKTKTSIEKLHIYEIYYIEVHVHNLRIYTENQTYIKYGTLSNELARLASYGFIRCSKNCIVSIQKIHHIENNTIVLHNHMSLHMSRHYARRVILAFYRRS